MATIEKKILKEYFDAVASGEKRWELRLNDFEVSEGDTLLLREWDKEKGAYTGRQIEKKVMCVNRFKIDELFWPKEDIERYGIQILSLE